MGLPLAPIQVIPPGLTGLLQLKQTGRLPDALLGDVAPILELRDWYMQARKVGHNALAGGQLVTATFASSGFGFHAGQTGGVDFTVPQGQAWYVEDMFCQVGTGAATDTCTFAACVAPQTGLGANNEFVQVGYVYQDVITARNRIMVARNDRSFWLIPGSKLGIWVVDSLTGTTLQGTIGFRATPCPL